MESAHTHMTNVGQTKWYAPDFPATNKLLGTIVELSDQHWSVSEGLNRVICLVSSTVFGAVDALYNAGMAMGMGSALAFKHTIGAIRLPDGTKLADRVPDRYTAEAVKDHAMKVAVFVLSFSGLVAPLLGVIKPDWEVKWYFKLGIAEPAPQLEKAKTKAQAVEPEVEVVVASPKVTELPESERLAIEKQMAQEIVRRNDPEPEQLEPTVSTVPEVEEPNSWSWLTSAWKS